MILSGPYAVHKRRITGAGKTLFCFPRRGNLEEARALPAEFIRDKNNAFGAFWGTIPDGVYQTDTYWNNMKAGKIAGCADHDRLHQQRIFHSAPGGGSGCLKKGSGRKFGDRAQEYLDLVHAENGLEAAKENGLVSSVELGIRRDVQPAGKGRGQAALLCIRIRP
mgnify:CR=1 FL=1